MQPQLWVNPIGRSLAGLDSFSTRFILNWHQGCIFSQKFDLFYTGWTMCFRSTRTFIIPVTALVSSRERGPSGNILVPRIVVRDFHGLYLNDGKFTGSSETMFSGWKGTTCPQKPSCAQWLSLALSFLRPARPSWSPWRYLKMLIHCLKSTSINFKEQKRELKE